MRIAETSCDGEEANLALLHRCMTNDQDACSEFFSRYTRKIFNTAYRILGEEASAEDALQETLLNIYRGLANFRGDSRISTWVSRITVNVCLGILRKARNKHFIDLEDDAAKNLPAPPTPLVDPLEYAETEELSRLVEDTFTRMSGKQRDVVRLHDMEGHTIQEIARMMRCPSGTIKSRLFYGRQEFKAIFRQLVARGHAAPTIQ